MSKPLVSVVIPSYEHARFVEQAVESVLVQDIRPLELIVIDDGSNDGSPDVIRSMRKRIAKAKVDFDFVSRPNRGAHETINEGLALARGEWLSILNSDDYYLPGRLRALLDAARRENSRLAFSGVRHVDNLGHPLSDVSPYREWYARLKTRRFPTLGFRILEQNVAVSTSNLFFSRELYTKAGPFRPFALVHDYDFLLRALAYTEPVLVEEELLAYRIHESNSGYRRRDLYVDEGTRLALEFATRTLFDGEPENQRAPWAKKNAPDFQRFWKSKEIGAIRLWLGFEDLSPLYPPAKHLSTKSVRLSSRIAANHP